LIGRLNFYFLPKNSRLEVMELLKRMADGKYIVGLGNIRIEIWKGLREKTVL